MNASTVDSGRDFHSHMTRLIETIESLPTLTILRSGAFEGVQESEVGGDILKYSVRKDGVCLSYEEVLELWQTDGSFTGFYMSLIADSPFEAYVWESPPITEKNSKRVFEFVLLSCARPSGIPDRRTYAEYFDMNAGDNGIVVFENLGRDALSGCTVAGRSRR